FAVIVTDVAALTDDVLTTNVLVAAPLLTTTSDGTWATCGLLEVTCTLAPSAVGAVKVILPVACWPATMLDGVTDTALSCAPPGVGWLTVMFADRGTLSTHAVICTGVSGTVALVVMVKVFSSVFAG